MVNLKDYEEVKVLQSNFRTTFDTTHGKECIKFLEQLCGWYDFNETEPNTILIAHGKRQVLATIKTLLNSNAEQIVALAQLKDN